MVDRDRANARVLVVLAALLVFRLAFAAVYAVPFHQLQTNELTTTAFLQTGLLTPDDHNIGSHFYSNLPSMITTIERALLVATGDYRPFLYVIALLHQLAFVGGVFLFASSLSGSRRCGALACLVASFSWLTQGTLGYGYVNYAALLPPGLVFQSVSTLVLGVWLSGRRTLAVALVGVMANFHPVQGLIVFGLMAAMAIAQRIRSEPGEAPVTAKRALGWAALYAATSAPIFIWVSRSVHSAAFTIDWPAWWRWMEVIKRHHVFPWRNGGQVVAFVAAVALIVILVLALARAGRISRAHARDALALVVAALGAWLITYLAAEVVHHPRVASLMFTRATVFLVPVACALVSQLVLDWIDGDEPREHALALSVLLLVFVPVPWWEPTARIVFTAILAFLAIPGVARRAGFLGPFAVVGALVAERGHVAWSRSLVAGAAVALAGAALVLVRRRVERRRWSALVAAVVGLLALSQALGWVDSARWLIDSVKVPDFLDAGQWVASHAAPDDQVLVPPFFSKAEIACRRLVLPDGGQIGVSMYDHAAFGLDEEAMRTIYGYDIRDPRALEAIGRLGPTATIVEGFFAIDDARLEAIERVYSHVRFLVEPTWRATRATRPPVVYANSEFVVRDLRALPETEADFEHVTIYRLEPGATTARAAAPAIGVVWSGDTLAVTGDRTRWDYQVLFPLTRVGRGARLRATCDVEVTAGGMILGVLDKKAERWIRQEPLPVGPRRVHHVDFFGCCDDLQLVLSNGLDHEGGGPSRAIVYDVRLEELRRRR